MAATSQRIRQSLDLIADDEDKGDTRQDHNAHTVSYPRDVWRRLSSVAWSVPTTSSTSRATMHEDYNPDSDNKSCSTETSKSSSESTPTSSSWYDTMWSTLGWPSSDSSNTLQPSHSKQRAALPSNWWTTSKNETHTQQTAAQTNVDLPGHVPATSTTPLDRIAESILYEASLTPEDDNSTTSRLLVFAAAHIPDRNVVSHDELAPIVEKRLDSFAEQGPYNVLLLLNPNPNAPTWSRIVSSYWSTSTESHKNVQRITIVGGGWWLSTMLTMLVATLVSTKSASKIRQCATLTQAANELGAHVFKQLDLPIECYIANFDIEKTIQVPQSSSSGLPRQKLFGAHLKDCMSSNDTDGLPRIVEDCLKILTEQGVHSPGIFRRSPSSKMVQIFQGLYERGQPAHLDRQSDGPFVAASLLRQFLSSLPDAVFPDSTYQPAHVCPLPFENEQAAQYIRQTILPLIGNYERQLLDEVTAVLNKIHSNKQETLMDANNLATCIVPSLLGNQVGIKALESCRVPKQGSSVNTLAGVLSTMIEMHDEVFVDYQKLYTVQHGITMHLTGSSVLSVVALVATLASDVTALPTRASTSTISRRARTQKLRRSGVKAIVDDAEVYMQATIVEKRRLNNENKFDFVKRQPLDNDQHLSRFDKIAQTVQGLWTRASETPLLTMPVMINKRQDNIDGKQWLSNRQAAALGKFPPIEAENASVPKPSGIVTVNKRSLVESRQVIESDDTRLAQQQAVYASAVAALEDASSLSSAATALPTGSTTQLEAAVEHQNDLNGPIKFVTHESKSSFLESTSTINDEDELKPITMTITLVEGPSGGYINQAALETKATTTIPNPKSTTFSKPTSTTTSTATAKNENLKARSATVIKVRRVVKFHNGQKTKRI
ncbi:hypothetical protein OIO90_006088 [Microbotryomycetes sp. JL221]|nr:hypothetical protein OIO90_006088 [Microbotryomycetes sp. JL221]